LKDWGLGVGLLIVDTTFVWHQFVCQNVNLSLKISKIIFSQEKKKELYEID